MRYLALATDYDGTIASESSVAPATLDALRKVRDSGRRLILVTGRELDELLGIFTHLDLFDWAVLENGALLYQPATHEKKLLGDPPPAAFVRALLERQVEPLAIGRVILATRRPHEATVLELIRQLGLELQIIFNRESVMILPSGINKATGLTAALDKLGLSPHNIVGVGDAENDHTFLALCECAVAVGNAVAMLKQRAHFVTNGSNGQGVCELVDRLIANDLNDIPPRKPVPRRPALKSTEPGLKF